VPPALIAAALRPAGATPQAAALAATALHSMAGAKLRVAVAAIAGALVLGAGTMASLRSGPHGEGVRVAGALPGTRGASTDATAEDQLNPRPGVTTVKFLGLQQLPDGAPFDHYVRAGKPPPNGKWAVWSCSLNTWAEDVRTYPFTMYPTTATVTVYFGLGEISDKYPTQADVRSFATVYARYIASVCLVNITNQKRYLASRNGSSPPPPIVVSLPGVLTNGNWAGGPEW
jgi:hypothetical protein